MDEETLDNWRKIEQHLKAVGKTDNMFYRRAVRILEGKPDFLEGVSDFKTLGQGD
jgi:hypothetical protein